MDRMSLHLRPLPLLAGLCVLGLIVSRPSLAADDRSRTAERPNVVLIMTDNHGAWTLGCYGNPDIRTPHLDRMAREGVRFTRAFASNPVCSPTRATFLTGLLPSQHGVHCFLRGGRLQLGPEARNTLSEFTSLPEILKERGYACGLVGKWHLGGNLSPQEGLTDYWITMPHGGTSTFYGAQIIEDGQLREEPEYLTDFWTRHAVRFIEQNRERPFFLYLAYNGPYALSRLLFEEGRNRHAEYYRDHPLASFPREATHPWQYSNRDFINNPTCISRVATEVSGIDDGVGTILETLDKHGLDENTVVVFVGDQGWVGGHGGFFGMGDHTRPLTARDGMMQIPMIWRHPGRMDAGESPDTLISNYDFLPTLLGYLGIEDARVTSRSPGSDYSPVLRGEPLNAGDSDEAPAVFYEFENLRCVRTARWKYVHRHPNGPHELFNLQEDPEESFNLVQDPRHAATRGRLWERLNAFYGKYADPRYDLWQGGGSQTVLFEGVDEELAQVATNEPPPLSEGFVPADLSVPEGFTVELAAGPPLVNFPMMACFDDRGRMFIAESAGHNLSAQELEQQLPNYIRMLEDTDRDGRFDRTTIFADRMTLPQGALWHNGALYVASPPNIWRLEDTNDDGVADKRDVLVSQFGYTGNAASIHGCFQGPDGRLYWCDGRHGHEFRDENGEIVSKRAGSYIFSVNPDGTDVRIHCGGGMDNPVEVDFTDTGEMLGTVNILYSRPRNDCLVHWLYGGAYPHSERVLGELRKTGELLGPVYRFGHVAVSGMMRYRSGVLDRSFRDDVFVTIFNTGKVQRVELEREGASYRAELHEFLSSAGRDFHPTDVLEDADGSLLVVDTGGWFLRGCPTSQLAKPEIKGAIYRIRRQGSTPLVDPFGARIDWAALQPREVVALLNDTRFKVRDRAVTECGLRGNVMVPLLAGAVARRDARERLNATWSLIRIGTPQALDVVQTALADDDLRIRLAACHGLAVHPRTEAVSKLIELLKSDEPPLRRAAARALGRIGSAAAVDGLLAACEHAVDRTEEHALVYALIEIGDGPATARGLASDSSAVRRAALVACDQMGYGQLESDQVVAALAAADGRLQTAALEVVVRRDDWSAEILQTINSWLDAAGQQGPPGDVIVGLCAARINDEPVRLALSRMLSDRSPESPLRAAALRALQQARPAIDPRWAPPLMALLESRNDNEFLAALDTVSVVRGGEFGGPLQKIATDEKRSGLVRLRAMRALTGNSSRPGPEVFDMLLKLLGPSGTATERGEAAQLIGGLSLTPEQLARVMELFDDAGPLELRELIRPFARDGSPDTGKLFLSRIGEARSFFSLPAYEFSDVIKRYPPELLPAANDLLERLEAQEDAKFARLEKLLPLVTTGDAGRGRDVFRSEKAKCSTCHRIGEHGGRIGPDLSRIGRIRGGRDLLEAIVFPSASFVREYEPYSVVTNDGKVHNGLIASETAETISIQQATGDPVLIRRDEIDQLVPSTVSIMPKGLEQDLTEQQLADIVAYLMSLK